MTLSIDIPAELEGELMAKAQAEGVSAELYLRRVVERELTPKRPSGKPLMTGYGILAKYGPAPSAEEIDENRKDMFKNFASGDDW